MKVYSDRDLCMVQWFPQSYRDLIPTSAYSRYTLTYRLRFGDYGRAILISMYSVYMYSFVLQFDRRIDWAWQISCQRNCVNVRVCGVCWMYIDGYFGILISRVRSSCFDLQFWRKIWRSCIRNLGDLNTGNLIPGFKNRERLS